VLTTSACSADPTPNLVGVPDVPPTIRSPEVVIGFDIPPPPPPVEDMVISEESDEIVTLLHAFSDLNCKFAPLFDENIPSPLPRLLAVFASPVEEMMPLSEFIVIVLPSGLTPPRVLALAIGRVYD
jgi:hypothetical protein